MITRAPSNALSTNLDHFSVQQTGMHETYQPDCHDVTDKRRMYSRLLTPSQTHIAYANVDVDTENTPIRDRPWVSRTSSPLFLVSDAVA